MAIMTVDLLTENNDWQTHPLIYRVTFTPASASDTTARFIELPTMHGAYRTLWVTLAVPEAYVADDIPLLSLWTQISDDTDVSNVVRAQVQSLFAATPTKTTDNVTTNYDYFDSRVTIGGNGTSLPVGYPYFLQASYKAGKNAARNDTLTATVLAVGI